MLESTLLVFNQYRVIYIFLNFSTIISTSKAVGLATSGSAVCTSICLTSLTLRLLMSYIYIWSTYSWCFYITHNDAAQSLGLLWTSDQLVAETSTWQHTTLTTDKYPCPRWDSHPRSQQARAAGRSPAEIVGSNPTGGMDICLLWVSCVVR